MYITLFSEKSKAEEDTRVEELKGKLELAVTMRQEAEAKLIQAENTIKEFMSNSSITIVSLGYFSINLAYEIVHIIYSFN